MESSGRRIPPSASRLAAAAGSGSFPRSTVLTAGLVLLAFSLTLKLIGTSAADGMLNSIRAGLGSSFAMSHDPLATLDHTLTGALKTILPFVLIPFAVALVAALLPALRARSGRGHTSKHVSVKQPRVSYSTALTCLGIGLIVLLSVRIFKTNGAVLTRLMQGDPAAPPMVADMLVSIVASSGAVMLLIGFGDLAVQKARIWRELHQSNSEALTEERSERGDRAMRAAVKRLVKRGAKP